MWAFIKTVFKTILWLVVAAGLGAGAFAWLLHRQGLQLDRMIGATAAAAHVNPKMLTALAEVCSERRPGYASRGRYGLFALTAADGTEWASATGGKFDTFDLFDPAVNARIGAWKFAKALQSWSQQTRPEVWTVAEWQTHREAVRAWAEARNGDEVSRIDDARVRRFVGEVLRLAAD